MNNPRNTHIWTLAIALAIALAATGANNARAADHSLGQFTFGTEWGYVGGDEDASGFVGVQMGAMWTFGMWTEGDQLVTREDQELFEVGFDLAVDYFFSYTDGGVRGEIWANYYFVKDISDGGAWPAFGAGFRLGCIGMFEGGISMTALPQLAFRLYLGGLTFMIDLPIGAAFLLSDTPFAANEVSFVVGLVIQIGVYF